MGGGGIHLGILLFLLGLSGSTEGVTRPSVDLQKKISQPKPAENFLRSLTLKSSWSGGRQNISAECCGGSSKLRLKGGKNAFWGRSYPWEGVPLSQADKVPDFYAVLGVNEKADAAEIRSAYRKLCLAHHPDRKHWNTEQEKEADGNVFTAIQDAWDVLGSDDHRTAYDHWLKRVRDPVAVQVEEARQVQIAQEKDKEAGWSFGSKNRYGFFK